MVVVYDWNVVNDGRQQLYHLVELEEGVVKAKTASYVGKGEFYLYVSSSRNLISLQNGIVQDTLLMVISHIFISKIEVKNFLKNMLRIHSIFRLRSSIFSRFQVLCLYDLFWKSLSLL